MDYTEFRCPVCNKQFTDDDDIVVCPECGAPHHRECYESLGQCFYHEKHGSDFDFLSSEGDKPESGTKKICPFCNYQNPEDSRYCNHCGVKLPQDDGSNDEPDKKDSFDGRYQGGNEDSSKGSSPFGTAFVVDPLGGVAPDAAVGDNITAGEAAKFVKVNTPFYSRLFSNIYKQNRSRFSFVGFIFSCGWLLYRKMYKLGTVLTVLFGLTMIARVYLTYVYNDLLTNMQTVLYSISPSYFMTFDQGALSGISSFLQGLTAEQIAAIAVFYATGLIQLAIQIVCGICGNRLYYKHCMDKISSLKLATVSTGDAADLLQTHGGVNFAIVVSLYVSYIILMYLPNFLT